MRFRALTAVISLCLCSGLPMPGSGIGWAQSGNQTGNQAGTLQVPSQPHRDQPVKAPAPAPRQPVYRTGAPPLPVVPPRGPLHPAKPQGKPRSASARPAKTLVAPGKTPPAPAAAPPASPDTAPGTSPDEKATGQQSDAAKPDTAVRLPRFASLRSDDVNMRLGPGTRYRIDWVYKRRDLPVEIEREYDVWRWVRDPEGIHGWVHQATLMGRRNFIVQNADATLRSDPADTAAAVAVLQAGVIGRIRSCEAASDWCNVQTGSYRGFLRRDQFWGAFPGEAITP